MARVGTVTVNSGPVSLEIATPHGKLTVTVDFDVIAQSRSIAPPPPAKVVWDLDDSNVALTLTPVYKRNTA